MTEVLDPSRVIWVWTTVKLNSYQEQAEHRTSFSRFSLPTMSVYSYLPLARRSGTGLPLWCVSCEVQLCAGASRELYRRSFPSVLLTSRPFMNTPIWPLRAGSLSVRWHVPYHVPSSLPAASKL